MDLSGFYVIVCEWQESCGILLKVKTYKETTTVVIQLSDVMNLDY